MLILSIDCGTITPSDVGWNGSLRRITRRPSRAIEATLRYRFMSLMFNIFEGLVSCFKCVRVLCKSRHSNWIDSQANRVVNDRATLLLSTSFTHMLRTTGFSVCIINWHIWHHGSEHVATRNSKVCWLCQKSVGYVRLIRRLYGVWTQMLDCCCDTKSFDLTGKACYLLLPQRRDKEPS